MREKHECLESGARVFVTPADPAVVFGFQGEIRHADALGISIWVPKQDDRPKRQAGLEFWPWSSIGCLHLLAPEE